LQGARDFVFSDFDYVEVVLDMPRHPKAISLGADPYIVIRPEGRWHVPGILERSAIRPVTRPSSERSTIRAAKRATIERSAARSTQYPVADMGRANLAAAAAS
jgi:hypothetical protein